MIRNVIRKVIRKVIREVLNFCGDRGACFLGNIYLKISGSPISFILDDKSYITVSSTGPNDSNIRSLQISERGRVMLYQDGLVNRLSQLAEDYHLTNLKFFDEDVIIDCGANIGELGAYFNSLKISVKYLAFEPSEREYKCCCRNNPGKDIRRSGLWRKQDILKFYVKTDTADSSLFEIENYDEIVKVSVQDLNSIVREEGFSKIKLLKLEAEGAEPEILEGASDVLDLIEYISVDGGPERGVEEESTLPTVSNILINRGFELIAVKPNRLTALFRNTSV